MVSPPERARLPELWHPSQFRIKAKFKKFEVKKKFRLQE